MGASGSHLESWKYVSWGVDVLFTWGTAKPKVHDYFQIIEPSSGRVGLIDCIQGTLYLIQPYDTYCMQQLDAWIQFTSSMNTALWFLLMHDNFEQFGQFGQFGMIFRIQAQVRTLSIIASLIS